MDSSTRDASRRRWDQYYISRDLSEAANTVRALVQTPYIPGFSGDVGEDGRLDSTAVDTVLPRTTIQMQHHPVDTRSKADRRASKRNYTQAKAYYGKTYIVPKRKLALSALALAVGAVMVGAAGTSLFMLYVLGMGEHL